MQRPFNLAALAASIRLLGGASAAAIAVCAAIPAAYAQVTYAEIGGEVRFDDGAPAAGATIVVEHVPSGSRVTTRVNASGQFTASGLRIGGPYTIQISGDGVVTSEIKDIFAVAGDPVTLSATVARRDAGAADEIVVLGGSRNRLSFGSINTYGQGEISDQPVVERRLQEIIQRDSRAFLDFGQPDEDQGISLLGFNTRFNNLIVDGLSQADSFGDNFTGLSTRRSPISLDAIESLSVETAPFDVQNSGFQGGQININTKSGNNQFHGSARYLQGGGGLSAREIGTDAAGAPFTIAREPIERTYGATLSGPIIKDKLFFFFSYEEFSENDTLGACPSGIACETPSLLVSSAAYDRIRQIGIDRYDYDSGDFNDILNTPNGERKFLAKLDWNISDNQRAQLTYQRTESNSIDTTRGPGLNSPSSAAAFDADTPIGLSSQLFSQWSDSFSTQIQVGYLRQVRKATPLSANANFGQVLLQDVDFTRNADGSLVLDANGNPIPDGDLSIGPDDSDQNNVLEADRWQIKTRGEYVAGDHKISFGYEFDRRDIFRSRAPAGNGVFTFAPITVNGTALTTIQAYEQGIATSVSATAPTTGNVADAAADFALTQHSVYLQDQWAVTPRLDMLFGLRYELFTSGDAPAANPFFLARYGISNQDTLDGVDVFLPRFGFNWRPFDNTVVRGGAGIFAGGTPITWFTEPFLTNGVSLATVTRNNAQLGGPVDPNELPAAILAQLATVRAGLRNGTDSSVSFISADFDIPKNARFTLAVDQRANLPLLGDNWRFTAEATYSDVIDALQFRDLRIVPSGVTLPTGTPRYVTNIALDARTPSSFTNPRTAQTVPVQDIGIFNTSEGHSLALTFEAEKDWNLGKIGRVGFNTGYTYVESVDVSPSNDTATLASVYETGAYDDVNNPTAGNSIQAVPHNFVFSLNYSNEFAKDFRFRFNIFGNYRTGRATSLVIDADDPLSAADLGGLQSATNPGGIPAAIFNRLQFLQPAFSGRANQRLLAYLPTGAGDPLVRYAGGASYEQILAIEQALGLERYRGSFIPRNIVRAGDTFRLDLNAQLEVPSPLPGKLIFDASIRNFLNLLDRDYGAVRRYNIRQNFYDAVFDPATNQIVIDDISTTDFIEAQQYAPSSAWRAQLGVRYVF